MIYFLPNVLPIHECERLTKIFDEERIYTASVDNEYSGTKNSYGFRPSFRFDNYLETFKPKIFEYNKDINWVKNVNTFIREYKNGSILEKHIDRRDISVTMSICLESTIKSSWSIYANVNNKEYSFTTNVGDAVLLFDADKTVHWRNELVCNEKERVVQFFLHWQPSEINMKNIQSII